LFPVFVRNSPEYNPPLSGLALPAGSSSSFAGPIRCRTLSNASSCAGGRISPFRPRTSSAYSLDGGNTTATTSPSAWNCHSPTPSFNLADQLRIHDQDLIDTKDDSILLTDGDLDAIKMLDLDFDSSQLLNVLRDEDIEKFKEEEVDLQQQQQQQQLPASSSATPTTSAQSYSFADHMFLANGTQTKLAHKIKVRNIQSQTLKFPKHNLSTQVQK
jgi:hypothetical protein